MPLPLVPPPASSETRQHGPASSSSNLRETRQHEPGASDLRGARRHGPGSGGRRTAGPCDAGPPRARARRPIGRDARRAFTDAVDSQRRDEGAAAREPWVLPLLPVSTGPCPPGGRRRGPAGRGAEDVARLERLQGRAGDAVGAGARRDARAVAGAERLRGRARASGRWWMRWCWCGDPWGAEDVRSPAREVSPRGAGSGDRPRGAGEGEGGRGEGGRGEGGHGEVRGRRRRAGPRRRGACGGRGPRRG